MFGFDKTDASFIASGVFMIVTSFYFMNKFRKTDNALWIVPWLYWFGGGFALILLVLFFKFVAKE